MTTIVGEIIDGEVTLYDHKGDIQLGDVFSIVELTKVLIIVRESYWFTKRVINGKKWYTLWLYIHMKEEYIDVPREQLVCDTLEVQDKTYITKVYPSEGL